MVLHILLLTPKPDASDEDLAKLDTQLGGLRDQIDGITQYHWGGNVGPAERAQGYTHGFVMTFESRDALAAYGPHPDHQKVAGYLRSLSDQVLVFDIEA